MPREIRFTLQVVGALWGFIAPIMSAAADLPLPTPLPSTVYEVEVTSIGDRPPTVTVTGPPDAAAALLYRPSAPILELQQDLGTGIPFGSCVGAARKTPEGLDLQWNARVGARCGHRVPLHPAGWAVDLLSYRHLRLRGDAVGQVVIALEDLAGSRRQANVPVATVSGPFDLTVTLSHIGRQLDARRMTALVLSTESAPASLRLDRIEATQRPPEPPRSLGTGLWVWRYREAIADPQRLIATCRSQGCARLFIQLPSLSDGDDVWRGYAKLLEVIHEAGIRPWALDGYSEAVQNPRRLADTVQRLFHLAAPGTVAGLQLDIEPYLLPGFLQDEAQLRRYLDVIDLMQEILAGRLPLSMVVPFWAATPTVGGRPLVYAVMDRADEVAVMSYRTDMDEVWAIADDILRYGDARGTPVWLALETTALPLEQHVVLRRQAFPERADARLDADQRLLQWAPFPATGDPSTQPVWLRVQHRFTVIPERLTFAGRPRAELSAAVETLLSDRTHRSFAGVILHDLDGLRALSE